MAARRRHATYAILGAAVLAAALVLVALLPDAPRPTRGAVPAAPPSAAPTDTRGTAEPPGAAARPAAASPTAAPDVPLWEALDESAVYPLPEYAPEWSTAGRVLVGTAAALAAAGGWREGDRLTLPVPQLGAVYRPLIEEIDDGPGGARSALGKVRGDDGRERRYVVTVGPIHVFAYVDTPAGPYELVGGERYGWLLPTSSMMAGFDHSEPDYILPEAWDGEAAR